MTTTFPKKGSNPDDRFQPFCLEQPLKQRQLRISYKGPLIILMIFSLFLIPLLPGKETNPAIFNGVRTRSYRPLTLVQTSDGGFALAGEVDLYGADGLVIGKGFVTDMWLMKTDASGVPQWNQTYGGADCEAASTLIQTADGGFALAGATSSYSTGGGDTWLVKTDTNGGVLWNQTYGGLGWDDALTLVQTVDGGFAFTGWNNRFGTSGGDQWLVKTDANGVAQWNQTYGGFDRSGTTALVQTTDGGFALSGNTQSFGAGENDMWLVKTDGNGVPQWNQTYGGAYHDGATALVQTTDGGFALSGYTNESYSKFNHFFYSFSDMWLVKTDANGVALWNQTYGGPEGDSASTLVLSEDGGFALAGSTSSFGAGCGDMWLVKTDVNGVLQWNQTYGGAEPEWNIVLVQTADGGYAIAASTQSFSARNVSYLGFSSPETNMLLVKTDANGVVQWSQFYAGADLEATTIIGQKTSGLGSPSLLVAIVVLIIARRFIYEKKK